MRRGFDDVTDVIPNAVAQIYKAPKQKKYKVYTPTEWKQWYISTMLNKGVDYDDAITYFDGIEFGTSASIYDCSDDPEEAALEDLQY